MPTPALVHRRVRTSGFTLVEVLMVVAIIGVLVGLIVPAVTIASRSIRQRAMSLEVQTLANAVEQYRNKYGDYPPDGTDFAVTSRHMRKAFPNISQSEILLFGQTYGGYNVGSTVDRAEALVFFLGGFSSNPAFPFSGVGGPIYLTDASGNQLFSDGTPVAGGPTTAIEFAQYNTDRSNPLYPFKQEQLTVQVVTSAGTSLTISSDELPGTVDLIPTYHPAGKTAPFVYFDSRKYYAVSGSGAGATYTFNSYTGNGGTITPYCSANVDTKTNTYKMQNPSSFQILCAGLDDDYGGVANASFTYPTGDGRMSLHTSVSATATRYNSSGTPSTQLDNCANFAEGILEDGLEN